MRPRATVLVPTFDHGPTLRYSVGSALRQTVLELEVFVVGDGATAATAELVAELRRRDARVRWFANPKGPRHGEIHRHAALAEARGEIVCYLADDDLWLPEHVQTMLELLQTADFTHSLPVRIDPDGTVGGWAVDLTDAADRELLRSGENRVPLACSAHTLAAYRRLPHGWRTTPESVFTDLYMFQQFLAEPWVRAVSGRRPTCLHFPSPDRQGWTLEHRCDELALWEERIRDAGWRRQVWPHLVLAGQAGGWAAAERAFRAGQAELDARNRELRDLHAELAASQRSLQRANDRLAASAQKREQP